MTSDFARRGFGSFGRLGPGSRIAGYLIEEQIGAGGMAVVFRARDEMLGRLAAVKVIAPSMADDAEFRARFLRESRAAAAVDSLHIIPVFGAGEAEGLLYIATRFVAGGDLARLLRRSGGRLAPDRVVSLVSQVASALDAAHAAGLVHRDVKPQNILVDSVPERPEHAYLSDFGLSKGTQSTGLTAAGQFVGTPDYSAPEQIRGANVDGRADQYALGCVAFTLLTGSLPFYRRETVATLFAHLQEPAPPVTRLRPELPPAVDGVVGRAMAKSPAGRYGRCGEFAAALQGALAPPRPATVPSRLAWPPREPTREDPPAVSRAYPPWEQPPSISPQPPSVSSRSPSVPPAPPSPGPQRTAERQNLGSRLPTQSARPVRPQLPQAPTVNRSQLPQAPTVDVSRPGRHGRGGNGPGGPQGPGGGNGLRMGDRWRRWPRRKALALGGAIVMVLFLAGFGGYEYLSGSGPIPATPASANYGDTTVYYSDGTTILGTFSETAGHVAISDGTSPWVPYLMAQVENELTGSDGVSEHELETGGLEVVTTISLPMEEEMYKAVDDTLGGSAISATSGSTVSSLPSWALVGAELQDPETGAIVAEYPGKGQNLPTATCASADCDVNTAAGTREPVGSSFAPYVLSTAVRQGMNVMTSTLDTSPYECIAPDQSSAYSVPLSASEYAADNAGNTPDCSDVLDEGYPVENDGGELIGKQVGEASSGANKGATYYSDNVQGALAASSNTGFTDLAHNVGTENIIDMAQDYGVNISSSADGGSNLVNLKGEVGMALGIASLTVQEQDTMLATIADNGAYYAAHLVKYWQLSGPAGAQQLPKTDPHTVLTPQEAVDVQYAMEDATIKGKAAATATFGQRTPGTVIGQTGMTANAKSGFFIGATTQYALAVGMFTSPADTNSSDSLAMLGGGGFGAYWPAKIWNAFATAEFSQSPTPFSTAPDTTGQQTWDLLGAVPKTGSASNQDGSGGAQTPTPTATATCTYQGDPTCAAGQSPGCSYDSSDGQYDICSGNFGTSTPTETVTCDPAIDNSCTVNSNGTVTCDPTSDPDCTVVSDSTSGTGDAISATPMGTVNGAAAGGVLVLPGSVLLTGVTRRPRRKNRAGKVEPAATADLPPCHGP